MAKTKQTIRKIPTLPSKENSTSVQSGSPTDSNEGTTANTSTQRDMYHSICFSLIPLLMYSDPQTTITVVNRETDPYRNIEHDNEANNLTVPAIFQPKVNFRTVALRKLTEVRNVHARLSLIEFYYRFSDCPVNQQIPVLRQLRTPMEFVLYSVWTPTTPADVYDGDSVPLMSIFNEGVRCQSIAISPIKALQNLKEKGIITTHTEDTKNQLSELISSFMNETVGKMYNTVTELQELATLFQLFPSKNVSQSLSYTEFYLTIKEAWKKEINLYLAVKEGLHRCCAINIAFYNRPTLFLEQTDGKIGDSDIAERVISEKSLGQSSSIVHLIPTKEYLLECQDTSKGYCDSKQSSIQTCLWDAYAQVVSEMMSTYSSNDDSASRPIPFHDSVGKIFESIFPLFAKSLLSNPVVSQYQSIRKKGGDRNDTDSAITYIGNNISLPWMEKNTDVSRSLSRKYICFDETVRLLMSMMLLTTTRPINLTFLQILSKGLGFSKNIPESEWNNEVSDVTMAIIHYSSAIYDNFIAPNQIPGKELLLSKGRSLRRHVKYMYVRALVEQMIGVLETFDATTWHNVMSQLQLSLTEVSSDTIGAKKSFHQKTDNDILSGQTADFCKIVVLFKYYVGYFFEPAMFPNSTTIIPNSLITFERAIKLCQIRHPSREPPEPLFLHFCDRLKQAATDVFSNSFQRLVYQILGLESSLSNNTSGIGVASATDIISESVSNTTYLTEGLRTDPIALMNGKNICYINSACTCIFGKPDLKLLAGSMSDSVVSILDSPEECDRELEEKIIKYRATEENPNFMEIFRIFIQKMRNEDAKKVSLNKDLFSNAWLNMAKSWLGLG